MRSIAGLASLLVLLAACEDGAPPEKVASWADPAVMHVVDSIVPMDEALARFRRGLERPAGLSGGAANGDELVSDIVGALEARDTMAFQDLSVNRAEWAWLYFPTNVLSKSPYELPPALAWFQLQEANRKGVLRALRELGGRELEYRGYSCSPEPTVEHENRIWTECVVTLGRGGTAPTPVKLFGAILERDGRFAVLSYDNDF